MDHPHLTLYEAVAPLVALTGLRLTYDVLRRKISRATKRGGTLPAPLCSDIYLAGHKRGTSTIARADLPAWAAWLKE